MINEEACLMPDIKACKRFMNCFDALFVRDQELWFGRYSMYFKADPNSSIITIYSSGTVFSTPKKDTLCFFDISNRRWVMILSEHCRISWQVNTSDDEIYIRMLASIAEDELKGSRGDHNDFAIANRIKNRYRTWFEERNRIKNRYSTYYLPGTMNNAEKAHLYFDNKACSEVKKTMNEIYGSRNQKRYLLPPQPKFVQFNGNYTTVVWKDGSHTVVKRAEDEEYDEEKAILFAIVKHLCKDNGCEMSRYFDKFFKNERNINKED